MTSNTYGTPQCMQYVYSPGGNKLAVVQNGALVKATIPLPGGETAIYNASGLNFLRHKDWLGSSRLATTWAHGVYAKDAYAPFGETYNEAGTPDRSFTGQDQDVTAGVYDYLFRKYDPAAGRWLSPDPSGWSAVQTESPQTLNRYAYVENDPMNATDPDGLDCVYTSGNGSYQVQSGDCNPSMAWGLSLNMGNGIPSTITPISAMQQSWDATYIDGSVESVWWDAGKGQYGVDYSPSDSSVDSMNLPDDIGIIAVASILHLTNNLSDPILPSTSSGNYTPVTIVPTGGFAPNNGTPVHGLWTYGHWCGSGGSGNPTDPTDAACMAHDACYAQAGFTAGSNFQGSNAQLQACNQQLCNAVRARQSSLIQKIRSKGPLVTSVSEVQEPGADGDINSYFTWAIAPWGNSCH